MTHKRTRNLKLTLFVLLSLILVPFAANAAPPPTEWEVTNTSDYGSSDPVVTGSLRWAMLGANTDGTASLIKFNIDTATDPGCTFGGPCIIQPERALPFLNVGNTEINGYSQPGALQAVGSGTALIKIEIDGSTVTGNNGFNITSADNVIKGLAIHSFGLYGIAIYNPVADDNIIEGNHIGTEVTGLICHGNGWSGVLIENGAENNIIGGTVSAERNIISCNDLNGIDISDVSNSSSTTGNQVLGNYIGDWSLDPTDQGNDGTGVFIGYGAFGNTVGTAVSGARNLINGNGGDGVAIYGPDSTLNLVLGNYIGVNGDASVDVANDYHGVDIYGDAHHNTVGGATALERNIISGNSASGVRLHGSGTSFNTVVGNYIGTNSTGTSSISNIGPGILVTNSAADNTIGEGNLISGNYASGIHLTQGAMNNIVEGNFIGTNLAGTGSLQNDEGVVIDGGATSNTIGGTGPAPINIISGNDHEGVRIEGAGTDGNSVLGNYIGTDITGTLAVPNSYGVNLQDGAQHNVIGEAGSGNLISGNDYQGVVISGFTLPVADNTVSGNLIGLDITGSSALANGMAGVNLMDGAQNNTIGGSVAGAGNIVSGNMHEGITLLGANCTGNTLSANFIGTDSSGAISIPNSRDGVDLHGGAHHNTVGGSSELERNVISGNSEYGVLLEDSTTTQNSVSGNFIGTDASGMSAVPNDFGGIHIASGVHTNLIGGDAPGEGNVVSGNDGNGIYLFGSGTDDNTISGNIIGLNATGTTALANTGDGITILMGPQNNTVGGSTLDERNVISGNGREGIYISGASSNIIQGNYIGTDAQGVIGIGNYYRGIRIWNGSSSNTIGPDNILAFNGFRGVTVEGATSVGNVITQNSIHSNVSGGIGLFDNAHNNINAPFITSTLMSSVTIEGGSSCPFCTVEVFSNPISEQQGRTFVGSTVTAGDGSWSLTVPCISGEYLTATATDATDGTSEFSNVFTSTVKCLFLPLIMR
jgi:titin